MTGAKQPGNPLDQRSRRLLPIQQPPPRRRDLPRAMVVACRNQGVKLTRHVLVVNVATQTLAWLERCPVEQGSIPWGFTLRRRFHISTSRFGVGQRSGSNQTPLGLHCVEEKIGGGYPIGTVFRSRQPVGYTWQGEPQAPIAHRILWLSGLEPGHNQGNGLDTHARYVYIHGVGDELTLGRPASRGCIHMAAADLIPIFDRLESGTVVWITRHE